MKKYTAVILTLAMLLGGCSSASHMEAISASQSLAQSEAQTKEVTDTEETEEIQEEILAETAAEDETDTDTDARTEQTILDLLDGLSGSSETEEVQEVFSQLLKQTAENLGYSFTIRETGSRTDSATTSSREYEAKARSLDSMSTYISDGEVLYEILRHAAYGTTPAYTGIIAMDQNSTRAISCSFANENELFESSPALEIKTILPEASSSGTYTKKEVKKQIENRILEGMTEYLGGNLTLPVWSHPEIYDFSLDSTEEGYRLVISMSDMDTYNAAAEAQAADNGTERTDLFDTGNYIADSVRTVRAQVVLILDGNGSLTGSSTSEVTEVVYENQTYLLGLDSDMLLQACDANAGISFLEDFFHKISSGEYESGSEFVLPDLNAETAEF